MASNASLLGRNDLLAARERITPYICRTPLTRSFLLSKATGREVWLKQENRQRTGSFKLRGAVNKVISLTAAERERGVVTASAGNHALGVAYACRALSVRKVDLFVQTTASTSKLSRLEEYAVNVHLVGATFEDAQQAALQRVRETGAIYIPAYDDPAVIAGQGTCGLEITEDLEDFDGVVVPVGGGGLIAGIAIAVKSVNPRVRVFGVNPSASPSALLSLQRGYAVDPYEPQPTLADPLAGGFGATPFRLAKDLIDEVVLVTEEELKMGVTALIDSDQVLSEPAGAAGVAAVRSGKIGLTGRLVVVISGGNIDSATLKTVLNSGS